MARGLRRDLALLALAGALVYLPALGARDVWNPDEARYAEVAREMRERGSWLIPYLNGEVYGQKPPLFFWVIAAAGVPFGGVTETAVRLPSAIAAIAALLLTFSIARRLFGRRAAWLAAAALGTCWTVLWHARFGQIDMLLTALVALAMWCWLRGWSEGRPGFYWWFFAVTGIATVTKGPAGMLPPLLAVVAFLALTRRWGDLRRLRVGRGLLLWAAVVLLWLVPAGIAGGEAYWQGLVFEQNLTRFADPWHHHKPFYYYPTTVPADFFPWSLLLPGALAAGWRGLVRPWGVAAPGTKAPAPGMDAAAACGRRAADGFLFALSWVVVTVLFFSLSPAKRSVYTLTMYPGLALIVGAGLDRIAAAWRERGAAGSGDRAAADRRAGRGDGRGSRSPGLRRAWLVVPCALVALLGLGGAAALAIEGRGRPELALLGEGFLWVSAAALAAVGLAAAAAAWLAARRRPVAMAAALTAGMAALAFVLAVRLLPAFDVYKSARPMSETLLELSAPGEPYAILPHLDEGFVFYTGRPAVPVHDEAELHAFLARPGRVWFLIERDDFVRIAIDPAGLGLVEVARDPDPDNGYLLFRRDG
jgi:4-amino-4-deoxy-L-arabinose transferase-like glycosyltransferase